MYLVPLPPYYECMHNAFSNVEWQLFFAGPTPDLKNRRRRTTPNEYENSKYIPLVYSPPKIHQNTKSLQKKCWKQLESLPQYTN